MTPQEIIPNPDWTPTNDPNFIPALEDDEEDDDYDYEDDGDGDEEFGFRPNN